MSKLVERAELLSYEELKATPALRPSLLENLSGWLLQRLESRLLILGPKGSGKTFLILKALIDAVEADAKLKPGFVTYKYAGSPMAVKVRRGRFLPEEDFWRLIEAEELIVLDDIHYICEDVARRKRSLRWLCTLLEHLESEVDLGKRVVLLSEEPLSSYSELFGVEEFKWVTEKIRRYRTLEILPPTPDEWEALAEIYGVKLTPYVMKFIYHASPRPRAFVKFCKLFGDVVSIPAFRKLALMRLETTSWKKREEYRKAIEQTLTVGVEVADLLDKHPWLKRHLPRMMACYEEMTVACEELRRRIERRAGREEREEYAKLENPATVLRKFWQKHKEMPWPQQQHDKYLRDLVEEFYLHPQLSGVLKLPTKDEFARKVESALEIVDSRMYQKVGPKMWLAVEPLRDVFADILYEPSTVEVVEELRRKRAIYQTEKAQPDLYQVPIHLEGQLLEKLDSLAECLSTTRSALIRKAICEMLQRHGEKEVEAELTKRRHDAQRFLAYALRREGLTYKAIAERMGIAEQDAWRLVAQAKEKLRQLVVAG